MSQDGALPRISVIIPTYRRPRLLGMCLDSLRAQTMPVADFEVIVVDDCSGPETVAVLKTAEASSRNVRWVSQPKNRGPAAARNRGVAMAGGELVLFVDDDIVATPTLVEQHVAAHAGHRGPVGVVGHVAWLPTLEVTPFMEWLDRGTLQFAFAEMKPGIQDDATSCFYSCNLSLRRADFTEVDGFDERFPYPAYEDRELAIRLMGHGFRLAYHPDVVAWHSRAVTLSEFCARMVIVGESAMILDQVLPGQHVITDELVRQRHGAPVRLAVAAAHRVVPHMFGKDLRGAYYLSRVSTAYQQGLRRGVDRRAADA